MASSSSSSSSSASSSAVASWYCWYSETRSFMLDSASVNSISSIPSPVYQWRKAFRRNMAGNCSETRLKSSWMEVELPTKVPDILRPRGGMSQTAVLTLFGIHSTKYDEFLFWTLSICSSTSFIDMRPRKMAATVRYRPWRGEQEAGGDAGHGRGDEVVQVAVRRGGQLERAEADVVQGLVVDAVRLVRVLDQ